MLRTVLSRATVYCINLLTNVNPSLHIYPHRNTKFCGRPEDIVGTLNENLTRVIPEMYNMVKGETDGRAILSIGAVR